MNVFFFRRDLGLSDWSSWPLEGFECQGLTDPEAPPGIKEKKLGPSEEELSAVN